jgi:cytochrome c nitrite reductase small subunit
MQQTLPEPAPPRGRVGRLFGRFPLWAWVALAALLGGIIGLGGYTFAYAEGGSYLVDDPNACVNCHIMRDQFDGWSHGTHKAVASCNDCHAPHDNIISKYAVKGINGFRHSLMFTTGSFDEPIRITELNRNVTQHACLYCHGDVTVAMNHTGEENPTDCLTCHRGVGHGK